MRDLIRQFLLYSRSERRAVIVLAILIVAVVISPKAYHFYASKAYTPAADTTLHHEIAQWQKEDAVASDSADEAVPSEAGSVHTRERSLFYFDPNTIGVAEWQKLGLSEKQAASIEKYKSKGGKFRTADDLRRIYVLSDAEKDRLVPYVTIAGSNADTSYHRVAKGGPGYIIEINAADTTAFMGLWGIGSVRSAKIVKYREQLGGFTSIEQVGEVRDISDSVFQNIRPHLKVNPALVHKLNINEADYETLRKHPYIHAKIAHIIIGYRDSNGKFESLEQLRLFKAVTEEVYAKILPYLTL